MTDKWKEEIAACFNNYSITIPKDVDMSMLKLSCLIVGYEEQHSNVCIILLSNKHIRDIKDKTFLRDIDSKLTDLLDFRQHVILHDRYTYYLRMSTNSIITASKPLVTMPTIGYKEGERRVELDL